MSSHPPEHLLTLVAMLFSVGTVGSGAMLTLTAQAREGSGLIRGLVRIGIVSLFCIAALVAVDVLIEHSTPASLLAR